MRLSKLLWGAAIAIAALGFILLVTPVSSDLDTGSVSCGTGLHATTPDTDISALNGRFSPQQMAVLQYAVDTDHPEAQECSDAISTRRIWSWSLIGVAMLVMIGAATTPSRVVIGEVVTGR